MIRLFVGPPGTGKSYHAMCEGLSYVYRGKYVVANFPVEFGYKKKDVGASKRWIYKDYINVDYLVALSMERGFYGREGSCLLIVDEAGIMFNAREWQNRHNDRMEWIKFFSQSRKLGYDVILVAQDERMIDRQIRNVHEWVVKHVSMHEYFRWLPIKVFGYVSYWAGGEFRGKVHLSVLRRSVAKRYDSMRMFGDGSIGDVARVAGGVAACGGGVPSASGGGRGSTFERSPACSSPGTGSGAVAPGVSSEE